MADPHRVVYIDDEPGLPDASKLFTEETGDFSVIIIGSAHAASDFFKEEKSDVILSDYQMPDLEWTTT
jgi:CheY-like chemotaxis protein